MEYELKEPDQMVVPAETVEASARRPAEYFMLL